MLRILCRTEPEPEPGCLEKGEAHDGSLWQNRQDWEAVRKGGIGDTLQVPAQGLGEGWHLSVRLDMWQRQQIWEEEYSHSLFPPFVLEVLDLLKSYKDHTENSHKSFTMLLLIADNYTIIKTRTLTQHH